MNSEKCRLCFCLCFVHLHVVVVSKNCDILTVKHIVTYQPARVIRAKYHNMAKVRNRSIKATQTRKRVQKHRNLKKLRAAYEKEVAFVEHSNFNQNVNGTTSEKQSDVHDGPDLKANLRSWAVKNRITQAAINDLLSILIISGLSFLPKDARTLMQTPTSVNIFPLTSGKMWYQSLRATLRSVFAKLDRNLKIHLDFNFDGMPLFNSSKLKFWPILAAVRGILYTFI